MRPASAYQALELGLEPVWIGAVGAAFAIVPLLIAVPVGRLADTWGERQVMLTGGLGMVGAGIVLLLAGDTLTGLFLGNALLGAGHMGGNVGGQAFVANRAEGSRLDRRFGAYSFMSSLGQALGPLGVALGGAGSVEPDTTPMFALGIGLGVLFTASAVAVTREPAARAGRLAGEEGLRSSELLRRPGLAKAITSSGVMVAAIDLTVVYIPVLGAERGLAAGTVSALLVVRALASMLSRLCFSRIIGWFGRRRVMIVSTVVSASMLMACALPMDVVHLMIVVAILGIGLGVNLPLTMVWVTLVSPPGARGSAVALRLAANRVGQVAFPTTLGAAAGEWGVGVVFAGIAVAVGGTLTLLRGERLD